MSAHMQFAALPRPEALLDSQGPAAIGFPEQLALLLSPDLWVGVAVGIALLAGARMLRARSNDI